MIDEIILNDELLQKYSSGTIPTDTIFKEEDIVTNEMKYRFWLVSIKKEMMRGKSMDDDKTSIERNIIYREAIHMIQHGIPVEHYSGWGFYRIVFYYEINSETREIIYIGSIYYNITKEIGTAIGIRDDNTFVRSDGSQPILRFLSIYKSIINKCTTCLVPGIFSTRILDYLEKTGIMNRCHVLITDPVGYMTTVLETKGFIFGRIKRLKPLEGGKPLLYHVKTRKLKIKHKNKKSKLKNKSKNKSKSKKI